MTALRASACAVLLLLTAACASGTTPEPTLPPPTPTATLARLQRLRSTANAHDCPYAHANADPHPDARSNTYADCDACPHADTDASRSGLAEAEVTVAGVTFIVEVADTPEARATGLSGRDSLGSDRGMWFRHGQNGPRKFLDAPDGVPHRHHLGIGEPAGYGNGGACAPPPAPGTLTADLPVYSSGGDVRYVLEINAGLAEELGIRPGDEVTVAPR